MDIHESRPYYRGPQWFRKEVGFGSQEKSLFCKRNMKDKAVEERKAYLQLHTCVILWGFTAILGRLISLPALQLVCWRMALVAVVLLAVRRTWVGVAVMPVRSVFVFTIIGLIVASHWVAFYTSIKISNASVAVAYLD